MLQLLQPFWLLSLAGLAVPIAIHLWNRKRGRRIKVGSVVLLKEMQSRRMSNIRLSEVGLLLVRCLLLVLASLLLVEPQWVTKTKNAPVTWVLVDPELREALQDTTTLVRRTVDSLTTEKAEFRWLAKGFPVFSLEQLPKAIVRQGPPEDYWSLLREVNVKLPGQASVYLLTDEKLQNVRGARPTVSFDLKWITFPLSDTIRAWIQEAYLTLTDSLRVTWEESRSEGNRLQTATLPITNGTYSLTKGITWQVNITNGIPTVQLNHSRPTAIDTATYQIRIYYSPPYARDAEYVLAATEAISQFTGRKLKIESSSDTSKLAASTNWLFWLSHDAVPAAFLTKPGSVFRYPASDSAQSMYTWLEGPIVTPEPIRVYRQFTAAEKGLPVWKNGYGMPLLTFSIAQKRTSYCLMSRFHPEWNDLVWNEAFPEALLTLFHKDLFQKTTFSQPVEDLRLVDAGQLLPRQRAPGNTRPVQDHTIPLGPPLLGLILLVFGVERWLSHREKRQTVKPIAA